MNQYKIYFLNCLIFLLMVLILNLLIVAFLTLFERKIMGLFHYRKGPNKNFFIGLFQPFNDALKLMMKDYFYPMNSMFKIYLFSPLLMFILIFLMWMIYPFYTNLMIFDYSVLYFLSLMSMGVYGLILAGWSSNSSYAMIGSIRSICQSISYEVSFSLLILILMMILNSMNLYYIKFYKSLYLFFFPIMIMMLISMLAEINRTPFDLSEGESELVSGFNVEYASGKFVLIFLSEYASLMLMMFLFVYMFFNSMLNLYFYFKVILMIVFITWVRMSFPRIRYDKLMSFCWLFMLPIVLLLFIFYLMLKFNLDMNLLY